MIVCYNFGIEIAAFSPCSGKRQDLILSSRALQAWGSIPFALRAVRDIPGAPRGGYRDRGITDDHLHLHVDLPAAAGPFGAGPVMYPHFQEAAVPGWLDKSLKWRHGATPFLDTTVVLAPDPAWRATLPNRKLPDRTDFTRYGNDLAARVKAWNAATGAAQQLADEFGEWVEKSDMGRVELL
ncbi:MAG: hypothetical protein JNK28_06690 [Burkholderiaceae bacterium]|nr:hypothetical protein [Burkholderiaceae bacterium]